MVIQLCIFADSQNTQSPHWRKCTNPNCLWSLILGYHLTCLTSVYTSIYLSRVSTAFELFFIAYSSVNLLHLTFCVISPPSVRRPLDPEDEELLREDESVTPVKKEGIKKKERPTDKGVSWLVKTQYISPLSTESTKQV